MSTALPVDPTDPRGHEEWKKPDRTRDRHTGELVAPLPPPDMPPPDVADAPGDFDNQPKKSDDDDDEVILVQPLQSSQFVSRSSGERWFEFLCFAPHARKGPRKGARAPRAMASAQTHAS